MNTSPFKNIVMISGRLKCGFAQVGTFLNLRDDTFIASTTTVGSDSHPAHTPDYLEIYMPSIINNNLFIHIDESTDADVQKYINEKFLKTTSGADLYAFKNFGYVMPCCPDHCEKVEKNIPYKTLKVVFLIRDDPRAWAIERIWTGNMGPHNRDVTVESVSNHVGSVIQAYDDAMKTKDRMPLFVANVVNDRETARESYDKIIEFVHGEPANELQRKFIDEDVVVSPSELLKTSPIRDGSFLEFKEKHINDEALISADSILEHPIYNQLNIIESS